MSLQDHRMLICQNISRKSKFMKIFKFLKYSIYSHLLAWYTPPVNGKLIRSLEQKISTFKVLLQDHCENFHYIMLYTCYIEQ